MKVFEVLNERDFHTPRTLTEMDTPPKKCNRTNIQTKTVEYLKLKTTIIKTKSKVTTMSTLQSSRPKEQCTGSSTLESSRRKEVESYDTFIFGRHPDSFMKFGDSKVLLGRPVSHLQTTVRVIHLRGHEELRVSLSHTQM